MTFATRKYRCDDFTSMCSQNADSVTMFKIWSHHKVCEV